MFHDYLRGSLEALLFAAGEPLSVAKLAEIMQLDKPQVWELLSLLERDYEDEKRGLYLRKVAEGYQLCTKEQHYELIKQLARSQEMKLSNAAMETLAIIAFKQPVTRSEMEAIRGVKVDGVVNTLLEYGLISETGRKDSIGHPILYGTTDKFLITLVPNSLTILPFTFTRPAKIYFSASRLEATPAEAKTFCKRSSIDYKSSVSSVLLSSSLNSAISDICSGSFSCSDKISGNSGKSFKEFRP